MRKKKKKLSSDVKYLNTSEKFETIEENFSLKNVAFELVL